jgi:hypothetical protein
MYDRGASIKEKNWRINMNKKIFRNLIIGLSALGFAFAAVGLFGCGSGSTDAAAQAGDTGEIVIGLTDAEGDFLSYTVDVLSITLTRSNGEIVHTLPLTTRVDFAQYAEMTEVLTTSTVPTGRYTKATMTLDYQNADIWVENADGDSVQVKTIQDENGEAIKTLEVSVYLENANSVWIAPGIPLYLTLDFDLEASNTVVFDSSGLPELTVEPVLLAEVAPEIPKLHRLRGLLKDVDVDENTFEVIIRPFCHLISLTDSRRHFGVIDVLTTDDTVYDINGDTYNGEEGLAALDALERLTAVVVFGDLKFRPYRFEAREVHAGSSVAGGGLDVVTGNVISRIDDTVVVKGASLVRTDGSVIFNDSVTVQLGQSTVVSRQLSSETCDIDDISVGQRIRVFGELTDSDVTPLELNAADGYVHMLVTTLRGTVVDVADACCNDTADLLVDLQSIDARGVDIFDFRGTGMDTDHDADPENYEIFTDTLDLSSLSNDTPVKVCGFVSSFGQAPPDFNALTVIERAKLKAFMKINWHPPSTSPFESISTEGMTVNLDNVRLFHHLSRGRVKIDLLDLSESPSIKPAENGQGLFTIKWRGTVQVYTRFDDFVEKLLERLDDNLAVIKIFAAGSFNDSTATLTADYIDVKLQ